MAYWWDEEPEERIFMEITTRSDIGSDLKAPAEPRGGGSTPGYALINAVHPGDVIVHYHSTSEEIVGASIVLDRAEPAPIYWVARGTYARRAGAQAQWLAGVRVPLAGFTAVVPPLALAELREREAQLMEIRQALEGRHRPPLYFPWTPYGNGPMRTWQSYLAKLPNAAVDLFPRVREAVGTAAALHGASAAASAVEIAHRSIEEAAGKSRMRTGQGFQADHRVNIAVEAHAMNAAIAYYAALGSVEDVHGTESYDLRAIIDGLEWHIEVKGTTGLGEAVILTANEVQHAEHYPHVSLFLLSEVVVVQGKVSEIEVSGGRIHVLHPWKITEEALSPTAYRYRVPAPALKGQ